VVGLGCFLLRFFPCLLLVAGLGFSGWSVRAWGLPLLGGLPLLFFPFLLVGLRPWRLLFPRRVFCMKLHTKKPPFGCSGGLSFSVRRLLSGNIPTQNAPCLAWVLVAPGRPLPVPRLCLCLALSLFYYIIFN
jgi:hypothetical protein